MEKTDSYLLILVGLLVVALIAVDIVPLPQPMTAPTGTSHRADYTPPVIVTGTKMHVFVIPISTLATVNVVKNV